MFEFPYTIRSSVRARRVRLTVHRDGSVVVTKPVRISAQAVVPFVQKYTKWIQEKIEKFAKTPQKILGHYSRREYMARRFAARELVMEKIAHFNNLYNFSYGSIRIGNQRSRWGSCSAKKNLNFNYKIVLLPPHLQDYIIVHELCHLGELNHSKRFWDLVAKQIPDHQARRKELRKY
jgi:predicted metal-dependent hydrolase